MCLNTFYQYLYQIKFSSILVDFLKKITMGFQTDFFHGSKEQSSGYIFPPLQTSFYTTFLNIAITIQSHTQGITAGQKPSRKTEKILQKLQQDFLEIHQSKNLQSIYLLNVFSHFQPNKYILRNATFDQKCRQKFSNLSNSEWFAMLICQDISTLFVFSYSQKNIKIALLFTC